MDIIELKWWLMEKKVDLMDKRDYPKNRRLITIQNFLNGELEVVNELLEMLKDVNIKQTWAMPSTITVPLNTEKENEKWNGIHAQVTAPKGTFERIFNEAKDDETDI